MRPAIYRNWHKRRSPTCIASRHTPHGTDLDGQVPATPRCSKVIGSGRTTRVPSETAQNGPDR
jgi:hypothetical protein